MAITICDLCAKRKICIDKNKFYPVVKCQNYHEGEAIKVEQTNEEWLRSATFDELAGAIYEWYTLGYTRGKNGKKLNSITEVVEWLKEKHNEM